MAPMRNLLLFFLTLAILSCGVNEKEHQIVLKKCDSLNNELLHAQKNVTSLNKEITDLKQQIFILSFPAEQRLNHITNLIDNNSLDSALFEISELKRYFPLSNESQKADEKITIINNKKIAIRKEEERRKALGFKVFKDNSNITINTDNRVVKCAFSGFTFGKQFTYDYINDIDEYYYNTADKNCTYILANLSLSTKSDYAYPPTVYACAIAGGKLKQIGRFTSEYESWSSYGAYLGNYAETSHDFAKVNTVRYKIATQITLEESKQPIVIIMFKNNSSNKIKIDGLGVEEVNNHCEVIKIINRNKI